VILADLYTAVVDVVGEDAASVLWVINPVPVPVNV
jgi:hypothetical protein